MRASKKIINKRATEMPPRGMKIRDKRVLAAQPTTRTSVMLDVTNDML
jgi:hypothetical protein